MMGSLKIVIQALLDFSSRQHTQRQAELSDTHIAMGKMNPGGDADTVASHPIDMPIRLVTSHAGEQTRYVTQFFRLVGSTFSTVVQLPVVFLADVSVLWAIIFVHFYSC